MVEILRAGVIGAGVFRRLSRAASTPRCRASPWPASTITTPVHAEALAAKHGGQVFASQAELIAAVDIVSIATPAIAHAPAAIAALQAGKPVYVEKPLAADPEDAARIVERRREGRRLVAACGFLERAGLRRWASSTSPSGRLLLEAVRVGAPSPRNLDVSVVLDLMIHDLDLALALGEGRSRHGRGRRRGRRQRHARPRRCGGRVRRRLRRPLPRLADRRRPASGRMRVVYPSGEVRVDFLTHAFTNTTPFALDPRLRRGGRRPGQAGRQPGGLHRRRARRARRAAGHGPRRRPRARSGAGRGRRLVQQGLVRG